MTNLSILIPHVHGAHRDYPDCVLRWGDGLRAICPACLAYALGTHTHHDALNATTAALSAVSSPPHPDYSARPWPQVVFTILRSIPTLPKEARQPATQLARHILHQSDLLLPRALAAVSPIRRVALGECIGWMMRLLPAKDPESILTPSPSPWLQDAVASMVIPILVTILGMVGSTPTPWPFGPVALQPLMATWPSPLEELPRLVHGWARAALVLTRAVLAALHQAPAYHHPGSNHPTPSTTSSPRETSAALYHDLDSNLLNE